MEEIVIPLSLFLMIFGIVYLFLSTRNRERMALIEKGVDASLFNKGAQSNIPVWKLLLLNLSLLLIGIGISLLIISILSAYTILENEAVYPAIIFIMSGLSLYVGFTLSKKLEK
ncbi:hypothetical protein D3C87_70960 [compost metagenome]